MPNAIQIRQTGGPEVLNWIPIAVGEPGSGRVRLRQTAAGLNDINVCPPDSIAPVVLPQKCSLFLTRPLLFHYIAREKSSKLPLKVRINVNEHFALKDAPDPHKALEARSTFDSAILPI